MTDLSKIPYSLVRRTGNLVFVSGQLGFSAPGVLVTGGITEQTRQAIANIRAILESEGATLDHVMKTSIWLTDKKDFAGFNAAYAEGFGTPYPARSTVVSSLVIEGALVEIEAIAFVE